MKQNSPTATVDQVLAVLQTTSQQILDTRDPQNPTVQCRIRIKKALDALLEKFISIDFPGSSQTYTLGINKCAQIVGGLGDVGFLLSGDSFTTFQVPGGTETFAYGINDRGQIVGHSLYGNSFHGF